MKINALKVSLFFIITLSIFIIAAGLLTYKNVTGIMTAWNQSNKMIVYLKVDATETDRAQLIETIKKMSSVTHVEFIDRLQAGKVFQNSLKQFSSGLITDDEMLDLIPETLEVDVSSDLDLQARDAAFASLTSSLKDSSAVEDTSYGAASLKKFERLDRFIKTTGLFICFILVLSISYLVALMVRVYIDDSKSEIEIYSLLGATRWSIYKLFLRDIMNFLCASVVLALLSLFGFFVYMKHKLSEYSFSVVITDNLRFLSLGEMALITFLLFAFIYINSFLTIQNSVSKLNQLLNE